MLRIIDQTLLPGRLKIIGLQSVLEVYEAIGSLRVRGAPAIGIAAAYGLYLAMRSSKAVNKKSFMAELAGWRQYLSEARPTAVNLNWALARLERTAAISVEEDIAKLKQLLLREAQAIALEDAACCAAIGAFGLTLLNEGDVLLTHCNAGHLATAAYGTALAPIYCALEQGMRLKIFCDETRPLLQGARLTAYELMQAGANITLLCDNMAASLMAAGQITSIWVGADRIAANGDTANKTGTLNLAVLARHFGLPLYVCAPQSTIDPLMPTGKEIEIEQRQAMEVTEMWFKERMAPPGIAVYNPAFDITPAELISAIITDKGILRWPYCF
ncbi:MAG: S-methyl-5-thioribose-1-phosphate isomerase [Clostridiales bacterium]|nr:S-methyl-5-thioribose-1-phosphate isomerase [Clostridiales bacterium]